MKLLLVEDNLELAESMKQWLEEKGFQIDLVHDGLLAEEKAYVNIYDCILLDLNLPNKDGLDILSFLRSANIETPVLILSARDQVDEKVKGLTLGADDYMTKPFQMVELYARIQTLIRRFHGRSNPIINIGRLAIDPMNRVVKVGGNNVLLSVKEFDILEYIAQRHPIPVNAEEITEHVYDQLDPKSSVLRVHMIKLRKKLKEATGLDILMTMRGVGYYLCEEEK